MVRYIHEENKYTQNRMATYKNHIDQLTDITRLVVKIYSEER